MILELWLCQVYWKDPTFQIQERPHKFCSGYSSPMRDAVVLVSKILARWILVFVIHVCSVLDQLLDLVIPQVLVGRSKSIHCLVKLHHLGKFRRLQIREDENPLIYYVYYTFRSFGSCVAKPAFYTVLQKQCLNLASPSSHWQSFHSATKDQYEMWLIQNKMRVNLLLRVCRWENVYTTRALMHDIVSCMTL